MRIREKLDIIGNYFFIVKIMVFYCDMEELLGFLFYIQ